MFRMDVYFHSDEIGNEALRFNIALAINRTERWQKHTFRSEVKLKFSCGWNKTLILLSPERHYFYA